MTTINSSSLLGAWTLASWQLVAADGSIKYPFSESAAGRLIYEASEHMAVFLMQPGMNASGKRNGFIAYSGRFELHGGTVHHRIDMASDPGLIDTVQVRHMQLANNELVLSAMSEADPTARHFLTWHRITS